MMGKKKNESQESNIDRLIKTSKPRNNLIPMIVIIVINFAILLLLLLFNSNLKEESQQLREVDMKIEATLVAMQTEIAYEPIATLLPDPTAVPSPTPTLIPTPTQDMASEPDPSIPGEDHISIENLLSSLSLTCSPADRDTSLYMKDAIVKDETTRLFRIPRNTRYQSVQRDGKVFLVGWIEKSYIQDEKFSSNAKNGFLFLSEDRQNRVQLTENVVGYPVDVLEEGDQGLIYIGITGKLGDYENENNQN